MGIRVRVNKSQLPVVMKQIRDAAAQWTVFAAEEVKREAEAGLPGHWELAKSIEVTSFSNSERRFVSRVLANKPYASAHEYGTYRRNKYARGNTFDGHARNDRSSKSYGLKIHNKRRRYLGNAHKKVGGRQKALLEAKVRKAIT